MNPTDESQKIAAYQQALSQNPKSPQLWYNLGNSLARLGRSTEAAKALQQATALDPSFADAWNNLAAVLHSLNQFDDSIHAFQNAVNLEPQRLDGLNNLGSALLRRLLITEAIQHFQRGVQINPADPLSHMNLGIAILLAGDLKSGFAHYEWRWKLPPLVQSIAQVHQPLWDGQPLNGRRLLLHAEQGFGDTLQFARYIPELPDRTGEIFLVCPAPLIRLLKKLPGIDGLIPTGEPLPRFDLHCPLLSLPRLMGTTLETIPAKVPYLVADPELASAWKARLPSGFKVGLVWAGRKTNDDMHRSISLGMLRALSQFKDITFVSLQRDKAAEEALAAPAGMKFVHFGSELSDFADTAALISNLDLLITIDTSAAHLAGAMGKLVWVLLPFYPDWRWMLNRDDTPWYPTMRLFRQSQPGDWTVPIQNVVQALERHRMTDS